MFTGIIEELGTVVTAGAMVRVVMEAAEKSVTKTAKWLRRELA